jgi:GT2 family glycosyltransferase
VQDNVAIVVLYYNKIRLTEKCVQSVIDAGYQPQQVFCYDNGSKLDVFESLQQTFKQCNHIRCETNLGFSGGFNRALTHVFSQDYPSALFCTNDTLVSPGAAEACLETAKQTGAGMVAPLISYLSNPDAIDSIGAYFDEESGLLHHYQDLNLPVLLDSGRDYIPGTAMWIDAGTFKVLGGTDESYHMYWEDVDFCFRGHQKGILQARCYNAHIRHGVGQTNRKKPLYTTFYFLRNRIRFCRRYLKGESRQHVLTGIAQQLETLGQQWQDKNDNRRLGYLNELQKELLD